MKKLITTILTSALSINTLVIAPINISAAGSTFEFENGIVYDTGDNITSVVTLSGASGGKAVDLKDSGDSVTMSISAEKSGLHTLSIRYSQPYDENGKYQNVIVNGQNIGQILCAYTGEGQFKTVSISANLNAGSNTVTVESLWGWSYIDCLTISESTVGAGANPIISRNVPAYSGNQTALHLEMTTNTIHSGLQLRTTISPMIFPQLLNHSVKRFLQSGTIRVHTTI